MSTSVILTISVTDGKFRFPANRQQTSFITVFDTGRNTYKQSVVPWLAYFIRLPEIQRSEALNTDSAPRFP